MIKIDGHSFDTKFNFKFHRRLLEEYSTKQTDGFTRLINQLFMQDPSALVQAYRCAIDNKTLPSEDRVAEALSEAGIFDSDNPYKDVYDEIKADGFLRQKLAFMESSMKNTVEDTQKALNVFGKHSTKKEYRMAQMDLAGAKEALNQFKNLKAKFDK